MSVEVRGKERLGAEQEQLQVCVCCLGGRCTGVEAG
jgi:hypothetical protein